MVAHGVDDRAKDLFRVDGFQNLFCPGEKELPEPRIGQERAGEISRATPPRLAASAKPARSTGCPALARRNVAFHAEGDRHVIEHLARTGSVVEPPGLVLVPGIHRPLAGAAEVVVGEIVVKEAVPVGKDHIDGEIIDHLFDVKMLLDHLPLRIASGFFERINQRHDVCVALPRVSLLFVLAYDPLFVPKYFVEVAIVADMVSAEERPVRLFNQELVTDGLAIEPKPDMKALFSSDSGLAINLIG